MWTIPFFLFLFIIGASIGGFLVELGTRMTDRMMPLFINGKNKGEHQKTPAIIELILFIYGAILCVIGLNILDINSTKIPMIFLSLSCDDLICVGAKLDMVTMLYKESTIAFLAGYGMVVLWGTVFKTIFQGLK